MTADHRPTVDDLIATLGGAPAPGAWPALYSALERAHAAADLRWLGALAERLAAAAHPANSPLSHYFDLTIRTLALVPGLGAVDILADLAHHPRTLAPPPHQLPGAMTRILATQLAVAQTDATLAAAVGRHGGDPSFHGVLVAWAQERVTRGGDLRGLAPVQRLFAALAGSGHPLAAMPLHLLDIERRVPSLAGHRSVLGGARWSSPLHHDLGPEPAAREASPGAVAIDDPTLVDRAERVFATSKAVSNGRTETRFFLLRQPISADALTRELLSTLPLDSLANAPPGGPRCRRMTAEHAFAALFWAAAYGGDYNLAESGAFARPDAWRSLAALVDAPEDDLARIEETARAAPFLQVSTETPWFDRVMTDLCFAVLRPAGDVLAVVAWTDSD